MKDMTDADEVLARRKVGWDLRGVGERLHDLAGTPVTAHLRSRDEAELGDLEPVKARAVRAGAGAAARGHVNHNGALSMRPLRPIRNDLGACRNRGGLLSTAGLTIVVAADGLGGVYQT
jgi:hypothetical protein